MIAVLVALYDEIAPVVRTMQFHREGPLSWYSGKIAGHDVQVFLIGPGVRHPSRLQRFLQAATYSHIVNIGFAGALRCGLKLGDGFNIDRFSRIGQNTSPHQPIQTKLVLGHLITAKTVVVTKKQKNDLLSFFEGDVVDLEGALLFETLQSLQMTQGFLCIKLVGDVYNDLTYLNKEAKFRAFFREPSIYKKVKIILQTGVVASFYIYRRKKKLQNRLEQTLIQVIQGL